MAYVGKIRLTRPWHLTKVPNYNSKVLDEFDLNHEWVRERIEWFAKDTTEAILENFDIMQISPKRSDVSYTGDLEKSIHWTIVNHAGGNMALVEFYYMFYGRFLELSASGWLSAGKNPRFPPIRSGMVPEMTARAGVQVGDGNEKRPWKAKPFITSQIRRDAKKLLNRMAKQFAYVGGMKIFSTLASDPYLSSEYGWDIDKTSDGFWEFLKKDFAKFV